MTHNKPRSYLQLSIIAVLLSLCLGCNALVQTAQHLENKNLPASLALQDGTLQMDARLYFGPTYTAGDKTGSDLQAEIVLKGSGAVLQKLELYRFSLRPARSGYYYQTFQNIADGKWEHVLSERRAGPMDVKVSTENEQTTLHFHWRRLPINQDGIDWHRERGSDVVLTFHLDGKYISLAQRAVPIAPPIESTQN